jgi:hypothetical protein
MKMMHLLAGHPIEVRIDSQMNQAVNPSAPSFARVAKNRQCSLAR